MEDNYYTVITFDREYWWEDGCLGPFKYKVIAIEGEYATIKRIDNETADTILIALALLPEGTDIGTELLWENLEYKIINGI